MNNVDFHSLLRRKLNILIPIIATSIIHFSLEGWENALFELGSERVAGIGALGVFYVLDNRIAHIAHAED